jgi:hypothetical protein
MLLNWLHIAANDKLAQSSFLRIPKNGMKHFKASTQEEIDRLSFLHECMNAFERFSVFDIDFNSPTARELLTRKEGVSDEETVSMCIKLQLVYAFLQRYAECKLNINGKKAVINPPLSVNHVIECVQNGTLFAEYPCTQHLLNNSELRDVSVTSLLGSMFSVSNDNKNNVKNYLPIPPSFSDTPPFLFLHCDNLQVHLSFLSSFLYVLFHHHVIIYLCE